MQEIAESAGTSIGSVYRFFPEKRALFVALVDRMVARDEEVLDALFVRAFATPLDELIADAVDLYADVQDKEPGWSAVWMNLHLYGELCEADRLLSEKQRDRIEQMVAHYAPAMSAARRNIVARTILDLITGMLAMSARYESAPMRQAMLDETKTILRIYAAQQIDAYRVTSAQE